MPLCEADKDWVKLIAKDLAYKAIKETLAGHMESCPHGKAIGRARAWLIGVGVGLAAAGFGGGVMFEKLFTG